MNVLPPELANLPPPLLIEEIFLEERFRQLRDKLLALFREAGIQYEIGTSEHDPVPVLMQAAAYKEGLLRQRINEAIQSWFLAYATGTDLDALAQWYDVVRLVGETDQALKRRVVVSIQGRSTGGTEPRYRSVALGADVRVADATVYTVGRLPTIHVAVFSTDNGGVADPALLAKVNAALQAPAVRMVNDTIVVASAAQRTVEVSARIWLLPQAPQSLIVEIETHLRAAWARDMLLGRDLTISWLLAQLQRDGVHNVELLAPTTSIEMPFNRSAALGAVTLFLQGRSY